MAVGDILTQPRGGHSNSGSGQGETVVKKGDYADLLVEAGTLHVRDAHDYGTQQDPDVRYVQSWQLEHAPGGLGVLTIKYETSSDSSSDPDADVVSTKWSVKNVQQQIPLSRFWEDGTWSLGSAPDGHQIALWRQEPR